MAEGQDLDTRHSSVPEKLRVTARTTSLHLMHDHPVANREVRLLGTANVRVRSHLHLLPRLWHSKKVYVHFLELRHPLWLGENGIIYEEYCDLLGNSYLMEATIWECSLSDLDVLGTVIRRLDPCVSTSA